jgi:ribosomal protein S18 acetylase RimI-like enzyme
MNGGSTFTIGPGMRGNVREVRDLYLAVAAIGGGLARAADEITEEYVRNFVEKAAGTGVIVLARDSVSGHVVGEMHGYSLGPRVFSHVLGELTIAVHPEHQGRGIGRALFSEFMRRVQEEHPDIRRVELIARESNEKAIRFYERMGFAVEGRFRRRIRSVGGGFEDDIPMAWLRPGF